MKYHDEWVNLSNALIVYQQINTRRIRWIDDPGFLYSVCVVNKTTVRMHACCCGSKKSLAASPLVEDMVRHRDGEGVKGTIWGEVV